MKIIYRKEDNAVIDIISGNATGLATGLAIIEVPGDAPETIPVNLADIPGAESAAAKITAMETALSAMVDALNTAYPGLDLSITDTTAEAGAKMIAAGVSWEEANNISTLYNAMK